MGDDLSYMTPILPITVRAKTPRLDRGTATCNVAAGKPPLTIAEIEAAIAALGPVNKALEDAHAKLEAAVMRFGLKATFGFNSVNLTGDEQALAAFKAWIEERQP